MPKDILIPASRIKTEIWTAVACLVIAVLINAGAILHFHTPFYELFTQIGYTVLIALSLYLVWTVLRLLRLLLRKAFKKA